MISVIFFFFSSRRRHTRWNCDWSSDVCSSDLCASPHPLVDSPAFPAKHLSQAEAVDTSRPGAVTRGVVLLGPLPLEQRLSFSVALLLFPIASHGLPAVVPDHRARVEAEAPAGLLQLPANVDVVAGDVELRVESANPLETFLTDGEVAAGHVFRLLIREQDVDRPAGCIGDRIDNRIIGWRRDVGTADRGVVPADK